MEGYEKELRKGSLPHELLRFIFFASAASNSDLCIVAGDRPRQSVNRACKNLLTRQLMEKGNDGYYRITAIGKRVLARLEDSEYFRRNRTVFPTATVSSMRNNLNQKSITAQALALYAKAYTYPCDKPLLFELAGAINPNFDIHEPAVPEEREYASLPQDLEEPLRKNGYYYTIQEIRTSIRQMGKGLEETVRASRLIGIFLRKNALYFIYNSNSQVVGWNGTAEREMVRVITKELLDSEVYFQMGPICIFTGKSYAIGPTITYGYPHGRMKSERELEEQTKEATKDMTPQEKAKYIAKRDEKKNQRLKADEESGRFSKYFRYSNDLFKEIFCIPLKPTGKNDIYNLLRLNQSVIQKAGLYWFSGSYNTATTEVFSLQAMPDGYRIGRHLETGLPAVYIPALECKMLRSIKDEEKKVIVVTYERIAESISHCLGPCAAMFYDIDSCEQIKGVEAFDRYGYPQDDSLAQQASIRMLKRQAERRSKEEPKSTVYIRESCKDLLKDLAKEYKTTLAETVDAVMDIMLNVHKEELLERLERTQREGNGE